MRGDIDEVVREALGEQLLETLRKDNAWHTLAHRVAHLPGDHAEKVATVRDAGERRGLVERDKVYAMMGFGHEKNNIE